MVNSVNVTSSPLFSGFVRKVLLGFGLCAGFLWLTNSEAVVDFAFGFNDDPPEYFHPDGFPLTSQRLVALDEWQELAMPGAVKQPSGLSVSDGKIAVVTDMSTIHLGNLRTELPGSVAMTQEKLLLRRPLFFRQGFLEAVTFGENQDVIYAIGGGNVLHQMRSRGDKVVVEHKATLEFPKGQEGNPEIVGLAYRPETDTLIAGYSPSDDLGIALAEYSVSGELLRKVELTYSGTNDSDLEEILNNTNVVGAAVSGDTLVVLCEKHSGLLWVDLNTGSIQQVWTIEGVSSVSGIAMEAGRLYLLQDHEYYQPNPPLRVLDLSQPNLS